MNRLLQLVLLFTYGFIFTFSIQACKKSPKDTENSHSKIYTDSIELWVFKVENIRLREAIRGNLKFSDVSFEGGDHDYYITLIAKANDQPSATQLLEEVKQFALHWGSQPSNQTWHHVDDGFDQQGKRKYKRLIVNSVKIATGVKFEN